MRRRYAELTPRERRVMEMIVAGKLNKAIAAELGVSLRTVELCRASVFKKMGVESIVDLVRAHLEFVGPQGDTDKPSDPIAPADRAAETASTDCADSPNGGRH